MTTAATTTHTILECKDISEKIDLCDAHVRIILNFAFI